MNDELKRAYRLRTELAPEASGSEWLDSLQATLTRREACLLFGAGMLFTVQAQQEPKLTSRLLVGDDGVITLLTGKVDMGQGSRTLLAQCVAEEMRVPLERVRVAMGDTGIAPDDGGTWASSTTPETVPLVRRAAAMLREAAVSNSAEWKVLGQAVHDVRSRDMVTGRLKYASDLREPGMIHARVVRPDAYSARVKSAPESALRDGNTVAVIGSAAEPAVAWEIDALPLRDVYMRRLRETAREPDPNPRVKYPALFDIGQAPAKIRAASRVQSAVYECDPVAHVPLEPRAVLARFEDGKLTIHAGTQAPFLVREEVARATGIPAANVRIVSQHVGGAYGGKQRGELEVEAARIARLRPGVTVRVAWSRKEEFERAYFRPAAVVEMKAALAADGRIEAFEHHNYNSGASGLKPPYDFADSWCGFHRSTESSLRQGSYRSLAAAANTFARESLMDECAHAAGADPLEYRLQHVGDERLQHVAKLVAGKFGWTRGRKGQGVSLNLEKNARLACMVRVEPGPRGEIRVVEAVVAGDFGAALNPGNLKHQLEGGFVQSLGFSLFERVQWDSQRILNASLTRYRVPRFSDVPPKFEVILVDRREVPPAGAGESPVTLAAPAIANAWFSLTGERRRRLPLLP